MLPLQGLMDSVLRNDRLWHKWYDEDMPEAWPKVRSFLVSVVRVSANQAHEVLQLNNPTFMAKMEQLLTLMVVIFAMLCILFALLLVM